MHVSYLSHNGKDVTLGGRSTILQPIASDPARRRALTQYRFTRKLTAHTSVGEVYEFLQHRQPVARKPDVTHDLSSTSKYPEDMFFIPKSDTDIQT
jgi:hypothetical protein